MNIIDTTVNSSHKNSGCYITPIREIKTKDENSLGLTLSIIVIDCVNSEYPPNDSYGNLLVWIKEHLVSEFYSTLKSTKI